VLVQRAAVGDVHDLYAPADAERRHREALGGEQQSDLEGVAIGTIAIFDDTCGNLIQIYEITAE
jgi:hypothetical protein